MMRSWIFVLALGGMTWGAQAQTVFAVDTAACSGELIQGEGADGVVYFDCRGTYQLSGGSITSDKKLLIRASQSLELNNVAITAPTVELWSVEGHVFLNGDSTLKGVATITEGTKALALAVPAQSDVTLSAGSAVSVSGSGGDLTLTPPAEVVSTVASAPDVSTAASAPIVLASSASGPVQQGGGGGLSAGSIGFLALLAGVTGWTRRQACRSAIDRNLM
jgi:hypothetical protein